MLQAGPRVQTAVAPQLQATHPRGHMHVSGRHCLTSSPRCCRPRRGPAKRSASQPSKVTVQHARHALQSDSGSKALQGRHNLQRMQDWDAMTPDGHLHGNPKRDISLFARPCFSTRKRTRPSHGALSPPMGSPRLPRRPTGTPARALWQRSHHQATVTEHQAPGTSLHCLLQVGHRAGEQTTQHGDLHTGPRRCTRTNKTSADTLTHYRNVHVACTARGNGLCVAVGVSHLLRYHR